MSMVGIDELRAAQSELSDVRSVHEEHGRDAWACVFEELGVDFEAVTAYARAVGLLVADRHGLDEDAARAAKVAYVAGFETGFRLGRARSEP